MENLSNRMHKKLLKSDDTDTRHKSQNKQILKILNLVVNSIILIVEIKM